MSKKLAANILILTILTLVCSQFGLAWTSYTHKYICDNAGLSDLDCASADKPKIQSQHPDISFRNHHCANNDYLCSARTVAAKYVSINTTESRGFAAHLYADSMTPVHWYSLDYDTCHKIFEDKIEEKLRNSENSKYKLLGSEYDFSSWNITITCPMKDGREVNIEFDNVDMNTVIKYVADQMHSSYNRDEVKEYNLNPLFYLILVIIISVAILFFYTGFKNTNSNGRKFHKK
jgi:hypothetical protein